MMNQKERPDACDARSEVRLEAGSNNRNRRSRKALDTLRARYDSGAVAPGVYAVIRNLEIEIAWEEYVR